MRLNVKNDERALLFKNGNYERCLKPGKYFLNPFIDYSVVMMDVNKAFIVSGKNINLFLEDKELLKELDVIDVRDFEIAIHLEDEKVTEVLRPGKYAYWNILKSNNFIRIDTREPEIKSDIDSSIYNNLKLFPYITCYEVASFECGILYYDNIFQKQLAPGRYFFWNGPIKVQVCKIDLRQQQIDMTGQEVMTEDKVTLRLNFICHYKIKDAMKIIEIKSFEEQLYILLQLILREYVGGLKLDDLLTKKQELGTYVLERLMEKGKDFGVEFIYSGLKDIILPGDIKEILNTVLIAEKKAQANVITRREEVASTRSLLNTAKMMEENQTLFRLKELEFLEKICDKIGNVSLMGGGGLIEQLNNLLSTSKIEKRANG